jgi:hypothetical protein
MRSAALRKCFHRYSSSGVNSPISSRSASSFCSSDCLEYAVIRLCCWTHEHTQACSSLDCVMLSVIRHWRLFRVILHIDGLLLGRFDRFCVLMHRRRYSMVRIRVLLVRRVLFLHSLLLLLPNGRRLLLMSLFFLFLVDPNTSNLYSLCFFLVFQLPELN